VLDYSINNSMPSEIYTDKKRMKQVILNLVSNAIKFTFEGSITVKVDIIEQDK
jgi:signal transduction histidine kinase